MPRNSTTATEDDDVDFGERRTYPAAQFGHPSSDTCICGVAAHNPRMGTVADRNKDMLADLSQRVRLVYVETKNGHYVRMITGSDIAVAMLTQD